jgi:hypothetical protein
MRVVTAALVAVGILWAADAFLNDGRYTQVILPALRNIASSVGFHI